MTRRTLLWIGSAVALTAALGGWYASPPPPARTWRVGFYAFPPYLIVGDKGQPDGFAVAAFTEAARRRGAAITWVNTQGSPDAAFARDAIDLYPLLAITDERRTRLALSAPWWENNLGLFARRGHGLDREMLQRPGAKVAVLDLSFGARFFRRAFPQPTVLPFKDYGPLAEAVCRGAADAGMGEARILGHFREVPACRDVALDFRWFRELSLTYAVGAQPAHAREADAFQRALMSLALDGTLTEIGERWDVQATNQMTLFRDLVSVRDTNVVLAWTVAALVLVAGVVLWQNHRVTQARQLAEAASSAKNQFLANVSHEIRTPLNGILGMTDLLRAGDLTAAQRELVDALDTSGQSLLGIIADILDYSKIEAGRLTLEDGRVDAADIAEGVVTLFAGRAAEKDLDLAAAIAPDVPEAIGGDPGRVRQILANLVGNALKFTDAGWVLVSVDVASLRGGPALCLSVEDTGPGVPILAQPRLFHAFTQVDESIRRRHGGTGLGLAICRELVQLMGGEIGIDVAPQGGSRFWVRLPIRPAPPGPAVEPWPRGAGALDGQSVLIVAAGPATRRAAEGVLASCGARVDTADDLAAAVRALDAPAPHTLVVFETELRRLADAEARAGFARATAGREVLAIRRPGAADPPGAGERSVMWPVRARRLRLALAGAGVPAGTGRAALAASPPLRARVLVADDNEINRRVVQGMLQKMGCEVTVVEDGRAAVAAASTQPFDLVLMDCQMPGVDGLEATRRIRAHRSLSGLPIVALTASTLPAQRTACEEAGMNGLLTKPCGFDVLRDEILRWTPADARRDPSTAA